VTAAATGQVLAAGGKNYNAQKRLHCCRARQPGSPVGRDQHYVQRMQLPVRAVSVCQSVPTTSPGVLVPRPLTTVHPSCWHTASTDPPGWGAGGTGSVAVGAPRPAGTALSGSYWIWCQLCAAGVLPDSCCRCDYSRSAPLVHGLLTTFCAATRQALLLLPTAP